MLCSPVLLGFTQGYVRRHELAALMRQTPEETTIFTLDLSRLHQEGIRVLALDFDGVLAYHGAHAPGDDVIRWLTDACRQFGEHNLFILSNKPTEQRKNWFAEHFPGIRFISGVAKKPFPDGLLQIAQQAAVPPEAIMMADDRLLTGCLAAFNAGCRPCWINRPACSYRHRPAAELFFALLRTLERCYCRILSK